MGMFDWIVGVPEMACDCGEILKGWQSKGAECHLIKVHFSHVSNFYTHCDKCNKWWEFSSGTDEVNDVDWTIPKKDITIDDFTLSKKQI